LFTEYFEKLLPHASSAGLLQNIMPSLGCREEGMTEYMFKSTTMYMSTCVYLFKLVCWMGELGQRG